MRKGKIAAQSAHASLGAIFSIMERKYIPDELDWRWGKTQMILEYYPEKSDIARWIEKEFTKICVYVNSEEELVELEKKAKEARLIHCLITDSGKTEFNGVPTKTVLAIGPARDSKLKPITGHLPLL